MIWMATAKRMTSTLMKRAISSFWMKVKTCQKTQCWKAVKARTAMS